MKASKVLGKTLASVALSFAMVAVAGTASWGATSGAAKATAHFATSAQAPVASTRVSPPIGKKLAELVGSDTVAGDWFGSSMAVSGSTAVAGAYGHASEAGRAYVFQA